MHRHTFFNIVEDDVTSWMLAQVGDIIENRVRKPTYIEVGANDGVIDNKLYKFISAHGWSGLSIEPVPFVFENLKKNYELFPNVTPLNMAIADRRCKLPFYAVINTEHFRHSMMSSFDRESLLKQVNLLGVSHIEKDIQKIYVDCDTLTGVCQSYGIDNPDVLVVDAEAYDDVVVKSLDMNLYIPELIIFEHKLLPLDRLHALDRTLTSKGYERLIIWTDTAYIRGDLLRDECLRHIQKALISLIPAYDRIWGGGNWLYSFASG